MSDGDDTETRALILTRLQEAGLLAAGEAPVLEPLTGGVSSDIWRIDLKSGPICVKQAREKLKVAADWRAPVARNAFEVAWMQEAGRIVPGAAPEILLHDPDAGLFAMPFLDPAKYRLWKATLHAGEADTFVAGEIGMRLGAIHAATENDPRVIAAFATDEIFHAIRIEPYLLATAARHPDIGPKIEALAARTAATRTALVHGDVSPKNILVGPEGPVFLDAECAWYGDPAFDLAFCLNHLLLKCLWTPAASAGFLDCFGALTDAYAAATAGMADKGILGRAASLLPALFLARVDGKSPVEYLTEDRDKDRVRAAARPLIETPPAHPAEVCQSWRASLRNAGHKV